MEQQMELQEFIEDVEQAIEMVQGSELLFITRQAGQRNPHDLVLISRALFERMQTGQRNPDAARRQPSVGQRNPDAGAKVEGGQRNPD